MRGTLHVTLAQDLGWILSLTRERMISALASRHRELDITTPDVEKVRELAIALLEQSGGRASRDALLTEIERAGQPVKAQRGIHLLFMLCLQGTLLQDPMNTAAGNGNTQFFVRSEQWVKNPRVLEREQALAGLCLRYFRSHGPATLKDFQCWSKLPLKDIKTGLAQVSSELESVESNGDIYWLAPEHAPLTVPGNNGMFKAASCSRRQGGQDLAQGARRKVQLKNKGNSPASSFGNSSRSSAQPSTRRLSRRRKNMPNSSGNDKGRARPLPVGPVPFARVTACRRRS